MAPRLLDPIQTRPVYHVVAHPSSHDCRARITADCQVCRLELVLCNATRSEVDAIMTRTWRCAMCRLAVER